MKRREKRSKHISFITTIVMEMLPEIFKPEITPSDIKERKQ